MWARLDNPYVWITLFVTYGFGLIGFADDYAKVSKNNTAGVSGRIRLALGLVISAIAGVWASAYHPEGLQYQLAFPVLKDSLLYLSYLFIPFVMIVIVGSANAVNLTDGLDGLAIMPVMIAAGYNAGPGRPRQWIERFGDPRDPKVDIVDWVETIPFGETRTYVMRVSEGVVIYRGRLKGASTPVRITSELTGR